MNYRHAYHAGNFADVMKHALLCLVIEHLKLKQKPFFMLDTHAGTGLTDLTGAEAQKTGEFRDGITRILAHPAPHPALSPWLAALRDPRVPDGEAGMPACYPGSPLLASRLARSTDRLALCELHPQDAASLKALFARNRQIRVHEMDGYLALRSMLPPKERRGLVLIDPPYESRDEFDRVLSGLDEAFARWASGIYLVWYPVKDPSVSGAFLESLAERGREKTLVAELHIRAPGDPSRLSGCGIAAINPPWTFADAARGLLGWLAPVLAQGPGARARVEWLTP